MIKLTRVVPFFFQIKIVFLIDSHESNETRRFHRTRLRLGEAYF